jgi:uncharacterized membrane protein
MAILILIIVVDLVAVLLIMALGKQHDAHHDVVTPDQSEAVKVLRARYAAPALAAGDVQAADANTPSVAAPPAE